MEGRLQQRLAAMHAEQEAARKSGARTEQFIKQLGDAGDALELSARVCSSGVPLSRPQRLEETDAFQSGLRVCWEGKLLSSLTAPCGSRRQADRGGVGGVSGEKRSMRRGYFGAEGDTGAGCMRLPSRAR